ncbi:uncharacterized protein [Leptinotarsa decemlineata]|uniref:uncharacterized protein n=1 Tax=Leptinotarsa decemlineata TaxID=7539 RepID=UPI003D305699
MMSFDCPLQFELELSPSIDYLLKDVMILAGFKGSQPLITYHERNRQQEGYMGDLLFVTIQDKQTNETLEVMAKCAKTESIVRKSYPIEKMYRNECIFYKTIWQNFVRFQDAAQCSGLFDKIAKCYITDLDLGKEKLILENLKSKNFKTIDKRVFFNKEHFELIFTEYGKFHGVSMALKSKFPHSFRIVSQGLYNYWSGLKDMKIWKKTLSLVLHECGTYLPRERNRNMIQQFEKYIDNGWMGFSKFTEYYDKYAVITHGDCWPSNFMFKYNENKKPVDIRFIDFHRSRVGTPVFDLSYCFYAGGSADIYDELDYYLDVYHISLSDTLIRLNCDPEKTYSRETLKEEWKMYCKFGFVMGLIGLRDHMIREEDRMDITKLIIELERMRISDIDGRYSKEEVKVRSVELIKHMYVNGFLN